MFLQMLDVLGSLLRFNPLSPAPSHFFSQDAERSCDESDPLRVSDCRDDPKDAKFVTVN